jgi:PAS domain S-box-containing protein
LEKIDLPKEANNPPKSAFDLSVRYKMLLKTASEGIVLLYESGNVVEANDRFCDMLGYTNQELMQLNVSDWDRKLNKKELAELISNLDGTPFFFESKHCRKDGAILDTEINVFASIENGQKILYCAVRNITDQKKVADKLKNSETRYRRLFESAKDGILILDAATGCIRDANPFLLNMLGYTKKQLLDKQIWQLGFLKDVGANRDVFLKLQRKQYARYEDLPLKAADGRQVNVEFVSNVYLENNQKVIQCNIRDISERKAIAAALTKSEKRYRSLLNNMEAGVVFHAPDGSIKLTNRKASELMGLSEEQLKGKQAIDSEWKFLAEDKSIMPAAEYPVNQIIRGKQPIKNFVIGVYRPATNQIVWALLNGFPVLDSKGDIVEILISFIDITQRKEDELLKLESLNRLNTIARMVPGVIYQYRLRPDGTAYFPYASEAIRDIYGISPQEVSEDDSCLLERIHPDDLKAVLASIQESARMLTPWQHEYRVKFIDGRIISVYGSAMPQKEADGSVLWSGFITDITEARQAQDKIFQLSQAVEQSPVSIVITDRQGTVEYVNKKFTEVTGYTADEATGQNPRILKSGYTTDVDYQNLWKTLMSGETWCGEFHNKKKNGELFWESSSISPLLNSQGEMSHFLGIKEDITEKKKAAEKTLELNRDFLNFLENTSDFVYYKDITGRIRFCSQALANITGHTSWTQMVGKNDEEVFPEELAKIYMEEEVSIYKNSQPLINKIDPYIDAAGNPGWVSTNKWPLLNAEGKVTGLFGISRDVTEIRKSQEVLNEYAQNLKTSNTELENFAYVASHDLQEPLRMVSSFLRLLEKKLEGQLDEANRKYIDFAVDGAERMKQLINALLQYSRVGTNKDPFGDTDLNASMGYLKRVLQSEITKKKANIIVQRMPVVMANKTLINELFLNLVNNALKYCKAKEPTVEIGFTERNEQYTFFVKDNGIGISPEYFDKIFIIFKRLHGKDEYSGTGIGLALCKKIVEIHRGKIWVESEIDKGSTFYFTIPK